MEEIITIYKFGEFNIKNIHYDQEFRYILQDFTNKNKIKLVCALSQAHVPHTEQNIHTIKESIRSLFHDLPYHGIQKIIMNYLVMQTTAALNYFPSRYGLSQHYSPRMILQQTLLYFDMHCKHFTGEYMLAHNDKHNKVTWNLEH